MEQDGIVLRLQGVSKVFPGVKALSEVSFDIRRGEVHAIVGENGAGKSTLIKVITGSHAPSSGKMFFEGREVTEFTPAHSKALGIAAIYQEFNLFSSMSVMDNIYYKEEIMRGAVLDRKAMRRGCQELFRQFDFEVDPGATVRDLSVAYQQLVEICKAIRKQIKVLILDEPTAPLTQKETGALFQVVRKLRDSGVGIVYISHRMEEIFEIADRVSVLRDGACIATHCVSQVSRLELIEQMVGREVSGVYPHRPPLTQKEPVLEAVGLSGEKVRDISFTLYRGEILGLAGLIGAGRTEMVRCLFGADPMTGGQLKLRGKPVRFLSPHNAICAGVAMLPEDRKNHGVLLKMPVRFNIVLSALTKVFKKQIVDRRLEREIVSGMVDKLRIKLASPEQLAGNLSGGNQQKVVLAKYLATKSDILIVDEPTRGIDVGAKHEIYLLLNQLVAEGKSIIMISSDMPELVGMSDRVLVMREGRISGELLARDITQVNILNLAAR